MLSHFYIRQVYKLRMRKPLKVIGKYYTNRVFSLTITPNYFLKKKKNYHAKSPMLHVCPQYFEDMINFHSWVCWNAIFSLEKCINLELGQL